MPRFRVPDLAFKSSQMHRKRRRCCGFRSLPCWRSIYFCLLVTPMYMSSAFSVEAVVLQHPKRSKQPKLPIRHQPSRLSDTARPWNPTAFLPGMPGVTPTKKPTKMASTTLLQRSATPLSIPDDVFFPFFPAEPSYPSPRLSDMSMSQMIAMNAVGGAMTVGVVYALASTNLNGLLTGAATEDFEAVGINIVDAALPLSASDVVTVTFSEAMAAIVAAAVSLSFTLLVRFTTRQEKTSNDGRFDDIQKAVGNGDFLLAQATALPLLESLGVPSVLATTVGVLFAAIPAEIVKVAGRKSQQRRAAEDELFDFLLKKEQQNKQQLSKFSFFPMKQAATPTTEILDEWQKSFEEKTRKQEESLLVDIASDIIKWLGYSVLCADLSGQLTYNGLPLFPGVESALFGIIASLSAQVYADILYSYFGFGGEEKQQKIRSRTLFAWASTYISEAVYAGIFFGIYEFAQIPAKAAVSAFLSGGADACYGSQDFDVCLQAFESQNPPGASPEAQLRSLVTTLVSLWNRYTPDNFAWVG